MTQSSLLGEARTEASIDHSTAPLERLRQQRLTCRSSSMAAVSPAGHRLAPPVAVLAELAVGLF